MATSETDRRNLYTGLEEVLGTERANILMSYLPAVPIATMSEMDRRFDLVDQRFEQVDRRFEQVDQRLDRLEATMDRLGDRLTGEIREVNKRLDRLFLTLGTALVAMIATVFSAVLLI